MTPNIICDSSAPTKDTYGSSPKLPTEIPGFQLTDYKTERQFLGALAAAIATHAERNQTDYSFLVGHYHQRFLAFREREDMATINADIEQIHGDPFVRTVKATYSDEGYAYLCERLGFHNEFSDLLNPNASLKPRECATTLFQGTNETYCLDARLSKDGFGIDVSYWAITTSGCKPEPVPSQKQNIHLLTSLENKVNSERAA